MEQKTIAGIILEVNEEGYMLDHSKWTNEIALEIAKEEGIDLTEKHFVILKYLRERAIKGDALTIRSVGKSGIIDIKGFYDLFPGGPLKKSSKIAGILKPVGCI